MSAGKFEQSLQSGIHFNFLQTTGEWEGTATTWFEPPKVEDESPILGSIKSILDGKFILHEYKSSFKGSPTNGVMIIGHSIANNSFQSAWVDSFHMGTAILFAESPVSAVLFSALGSYGGPDIPEPWGWRTEMALIAKDELVIRAFNIEPGGKEQIATEIKYTRKR